jgi:tetratricopeptide (TPR) repeat protein
VIARSSVRDYSPEGRNLAQIGRELGVSTLMEGTVRRLGDRIRVYVNLIDAENQSMIWSDTYEDDIQDVFGLQSRIAREITDALQTTLTANEQQRLEQQPTDNQQAYLFYLQGLEYLSRSRHLEENPLAAERLLRRALQEDPRFAHAYAKLALVYSDLYWFHGSTSERLEQMREAAERAELLDPNLAETQLALGLYYFWSDTDPGQTLSHFESALQQFPNYPDLYQFTGLTHRRLGNWDKAEIYFTKAVELDPRNPNHYQELVAIYGLTRDFDKTLVVLERLLELNPDASEQMRAAKAWMILGRDGTLDGYESWREEVYPADPTEAEPYWWYDYYYMKRDWDAAVQILNSITSEVAAQYEVSYLLRDYLIAKIYDRKGDRTTALQYYDQARLHLESLHEEDPDDHRYRKALGQVYARMGEPEKAIREGEIAVRMRPLSKFAYQGSWSNWDLAYIYTWSGHVEEAIDLIEHLLTVPGFFTRNWLRLNPDWDPLRNHPRFQELIAEEDEPYFNDTGILAAGTIRGSGNTFISGLGGVLQYDTRDNHFYPESGSLHKFEIYTASKMIGSDYGFTRFTFDARRYISLYPSHVIAIQAVGMFTAGSVPFRVLPSVGNVFRGYSSVRYIDRHLIALQAEYRVVPLTWRVGFTAFAGISDVFSQLNDISHENLKYVVGMGIRYLSIPSIA